MADKTIGDLTATTAGAIDADDVLEIEVDGVSFKVLTADLAQALVVLGNTASTPQTISTFTTSARSLVLADMGKLIRSSTTAQARVCIPAAADVAFPEGAYIDLVQWGSGALEVVGNAGVTVTGATNTNSAYATKSGMKVEKMPEANVWWLVGDTK